VPIGAYANAGAGDEGLGWGATDRNAADAYADLAERWVEAGASVVGGCCGTGPPHVQALAERLA
jgi:S-methylmethionine-dependent homocysteine/selenocysteine methylase